ncbi:MAG: hypothetical protein MUC58_13935 [Rhizobiaceae bacterium]|nr:hypothetical protein [Rhizobiaceae bacterium]
MSGRLEARFAAIRVRVADGPAQHIGSMGAQHLPGEEVMLIGEHRLWGERNFHPANLPAGAPLQCLADAQPAPASCPDSRHNLLFPDPPE